MRAVTPGKHSFHRCAAGKIARGQILRIAGSAHAGGLNPLTDQTLTTDGNLTFNGGGLVAILGGTGPGESTLVDVTGSVAMSSGLISGGGSDTLTGELGADTFVLARGDGGDAIDLADLITDFEDGTDTIGLAGGLTVADLTIGASGTGATAISVVDAVSGASEFLAVVQVDTGNLLDATDFTLIV